MSVIESKRLRLRRLKMSDLAHMVELETDPDIVKFTPSRFPLSEEKIEERLRGWVGKAPALEPLGMWAAETKNGDFVGWCMLINTDLPYPELGFMLLKRHWGKGFASEIAQTLIDHAVKTLKLDKIMARTDDDNVASIKVLGKVGMKFLSSSESFDAVLGRDIVTKLYIVN